MSSTQICSTAMAWHRERRLVNAQVCSPFVSNTNTSSLIHSMILQAEAQAKASASTALSREALRTLRNQRAEQLQAALSQQAEQLLQAAARQALSRQALQRFRSPQVTAAHDEFIGASTSSAGRVSICSSISNEGSTSNDSEQGSSIFPIPSELVVKKNENVITSSSTSAQSSPSKNSRYQARKFPRYNLFYRLERHLLLHQRGANQVTSSSSTSGTSDADEAKNKFYQALGLPPLPSRYEGVPIPKFWFLSSKGKDKKRSHRKSHGVASFTEIAQIVASNWKCCDEETMEFVTEVSKKLKEVYADTVISDNGSQEGGSSSSSVSSDNSSISSPSCMNIITTTPSTHLNAKNTNKRPMKMYVSKRRSSKVSQEDKSTRVLSEEDHALFQIVMMRQVKKRRVN